MGIEVDANQGGERGMWAAFEVHLLLLYQTVSISTMAT